jgi:hypothetical protein
LAYSHSADIWFLKSCQKPRKDGNWPRDVVIGENCDLGTHTRDGLPKLKPFIGNAGLVNPDPKVLKRRGKLKKPCISVEGSYQNKLKRITCQKATDRIPQFFEIIFDCRNDDGNIVVCESRILWFRNGLIPVMCKDVYYQSHIAMKAVGTVRMDYSRCISKDFLNAEGLEGIDQFRAASPE